MEVYISSPNGTAAGINSEPGLHISFRIERALTWAHTVCVHARTE